MVAVDLIYVQPFTAVAAIDVAQTGGKGATLARLFQAGLPVPPGCIVTTQALATYLDTHGLHASATAEEACRAVLAGEPPGVIQAELRTVLSQLDAAPSGWAVRSSAVSEDSATASFAGVYESFLEVQEGDLWPSIRNCWASWWSARALAYRQRLGETTPLPHMAVVVQAMVSARCAGVAFTAEPIQGDRLRMVINAAPGLGDTVVSGVVEPEQYVLAKAPAIHLLETRLLRPDQAPLLPADVVVALGALLQRVETLCGSPQDVEWAWDGTRCWILQSRPITTLADGPATAADIVWSNANLKDVLPGLVSPFTWSLMQPQLATAIRQQYAQVGYAVAADCPVMRRFWGRPYFNLSLFQEAAYTLFGTTAEKQVAHLGGAMVQGFTPRGTPSRWQRLRWLCNALRVGRLVERARRATPASFAAVQHRWQDELQQAAQLDRPALLRKLETFSAVTQAFLLQHLHLTWAMSGNFGYLRELIGRWLPQAPPGLVAELVTGMGDVSSAEHSYRLWELSRLARQSPQVRTFLEQQQWHTWREALAGTPFAHAWQQFLDAFGHRSLYEVEMANPRWREQPAYLFEVLRAYAALPQEAAPFDPQAQAQRRQAAEREVLRQLAPWRRPWFRTRLRRTQEFSRLRENSKSHLVRLIDIGRCMALTAARFLVHDGLLAEPESIFMLEGDEIKGALQGEKSRQELTRLITQRRLERQRYAALQPPEVIVGERPLYEPPSVGTGMALQGLPSSPGRVAGTARVLRSPQEGTRLQPGEILVAPSTDPGWTPLFLLAAGLVMETGGYLSHGAIVAREYGIPAVLNVPLATHRIPDGSALVLDGGEGMVWLEEGGSAEAR
jgi:phosphohistidine swiveling domain-containing protein